MYIRMYAYVYAYCKIQGINGKNKETFLNILLVVQCLVSSFLIDAYYYINFTHLFNKNDFKPHFIYK